MSVQNDVYKNMTNPEIVAAFGRLSEDEQTAALASLSPERQESLKEVIASQPSPDGARAAVLQRLGREKQLRDAQAYTFDGVSPNGPLVTEANPHAEHPNAEAAIDVMVAVTAEKQKGDLLALAGQDTSTTLSTDEAAAGKIEATGAVTEEKAEASDDAGKKLRGRLPDDFPGRRALADADINTYAQARKWSQSGERIAGVGDATKAQIDAALTE